MICQEIRSMFSLQRVSQRFLGELRRRQKHVVLLVNKVDLVPTWVTRRWIAELMKEKKNACSDLDVLITLYICLLPFILI